MEEMSMQWHERIDITIALMILFSVIMLATLSDEQVRKNSKEIYRITLVCFGTSIFLYIAKVILFILLGL
jgi:predicted DNA-binding ArsR family transcriptional regulator